MQYKPEHKDLVENIVKNCPGYKGNEDLFGEMVSETLKKAQGFLEGALDTASLEVYIKKIAGSVIVEIIKNAEKIRANKIENININASFEEIPVDYETDAEGKIIYRIEPPFGPEDITKEKIADKKIENIKEKIIELNKNNSSKNYKEIFELRFVRQMNYGEIAKKLEIKENEVSKVILEILKEIDYV